MSKSTTPTTDQAPIAPEAMLTILIAAEDQAEAAGQLDPDRRVTCHTCRTWATTTHINDPAHWRAIERAAQRSAAWITVTNPDDPTDSMPIYDGPARDAGQRLVPGTYDATDEGRPRILTVSDDGTATAVSP